MKRYLALLLLLPATAAAQDVDRGAALAKRWCANCHVVMRSAATANANGLPTFPKLAADPKMTDVALRAVMSAEHGRMPDFSLSKRDQDDLIAYIHGLRQN